MQLLIRRYLTKHLANELLGPQISFFPGVWPGKSLHLRWCSLLTQLLIDLLAVDHPIQQTGSGPENGVLISYFARWSTFLFTSNSMCPSAHLEVSPLRRDRTQNIVSVAFTYQLRLNGNGVKHSNSGLTVI